MIPAHVDILHTKTLRHKGEGYNVACCFALARNEDLHNLYYSRNITVIKIKKDESGWSCSGDEGDEKCVQDIGSIA